jgi:ribonuclease D
VLREDPAEPAFEYVETPEQLSGAVACVERTRVLAVDTEADSMHAFFEKVCLVQLATEEDDAFILDPLALDGLEPLASAMADPDVITVFHGADFDVTSLRRDFGFEFAGVFDTMVAAQLLGDERISLQDLVERFFDVRLAKAFTRCDWGRRPLSDEQLEYCYLDVAYLVRLMRVQEERLAEADLEEEAAIEFTRLAARQPAAREFDPHGWRRIKGARDLDPERQSVLMRLFVERDRHARKLDRPTFKVVGNDTLLRLARAMPDSQGSLRRIKGVSSYAAGRMCRDLLDAVKEGRRRGAPPERPPRRADPRRRLDYVAQKRLGRLRDWRSETAEKQSTTTLAILPNYAMFEVARMRPRSLEELSAIDGVGARRAEKWGVRILELVG